ncbi:flavodoxin domain-containing protein [Marimonas arenosa]|uniref:Protoporphyrinogen oxidase n=1 Tax=Marimonas arenosa TaxID=1795305 RepID=A0AAE3WDM5_9RHOB|nr:flavodoxin domain-containing protein [Marimonas arenosa]MDQ2089815.1 protoporphyrinogen oxidase [Marimonas arenosa]
MKVLVAYATREGHTRKIARHVTDRIYDAGNTAELLALGDAGDVDLQRFDRVILAAPIHVGHYRRALTDFASSHANSLAAMPTLFLSVSLAAAGHDAEDWKTLDRILDEFEEATGWKPDRVEQIAGAYRPSDYDIFTRFIMRRILANKDPEADLDADRDYTDWPGLESVIDDWLG